MAVASEKTYILQEMAMVIIYNVNLINEFVKNIILLLIIYFYRTNQIQSMSKEH